MRDADGIKTGDIYRRITCQ